MKKFILTTAIILFPFAVWAQNCSTPPSCATLGFTKSAADCSGKTILKCPFDTNKVYCDDAAAKDFEPEVGDVYYSDGTYDNRIIKGKTPIGVVSYVGPDRRLVLALEEKGLAWSDENRDIPCIDNNLNTNDFNGKANTQCIMNQKGSHKYPSVEYCNSYSPGGNGKWYLPALGELNLSCANTSVINKTLTKLNKTILGYNKYENRSSSEKSSSSSLTIRFHQSCYVSTGDSKQSDYYRSTRCMLSF